MLHRRTNTTITPFPFTGKEKDPLRLYLQSGELCRARLTSPPDLLTGYSYFGPGSIDNFHLDYAGTLTHEMGHAWGLPDSDSFAEVGNSLHKAENHNYGIMSYSIGRTILPHELQYGVNRIVKEANISTNDIVRLHVFGSLIRKPSVIQ